MINFCESNELRVADMTVPVDSFTYLSPAHNSTSWLDHVLSSGDVILCDMDVRHDLALFDHFPVVFNVDISRYEFDPTSHDVDSSDALISSFVDWKSFNRDVYVTKVENLFSYLNVCDDINCTEDHFAEIDRNFDLMVRYLKEGTETFTFHREQKFRPVAGWNSYCKEKYSNARCAFFSWMEAGKVRIGSEFERMKETRKLFVKALNYCKHNKQKISDEIIANSFYEKNNVNFWNEVRKRKPGKVLNVTEIDNVKDSADIAKIYHDGMASLVQIQ